MFKKDKIFDKLYLYKVFDKDNKNYYGLTKDPKTRFKAHKCPKQFSTIKYMDRDTLQFEIVKELDNIKYIDALKEESKLIDENDCVNRQVSYRPEFYKRDIYHKQYYKDHREEQLANMKIKYQNNKQYFIERATASYNKRKHILNEKFKCECGGNYTYKHKKDHYTTQKHINHFHNNKINDNITDG